MNRNLIYTLIGEIIVYMIVLGIVVIMYPAIQIQLSLILAAFYYLFGTVVYIVCDIIVNFIIKKWNR